MFNSNKWLNIVGTILNGNEIVSLSLCFEPKSTEMNPKLICWWSNNLYCIHSFIHSALQYSINFYSIACSSSSCIVVTNYATIVSHSTKTVFFDVEKWNEQQRSRNLFSFNLFEFERFVPGRIHSAMHTCIVLVSPCVCKCQSRIY